MNLKEMVGPIVNRCIDAAVMVMSITWFALKTIGIIKDVEDPKDVQTLPSITCWVCEGQGEVPVFDRANRVSGFAECSECEGSGVLEWEDQ